MFIVNTVATEAGEEALTECHGHQAHGSAKRHLGFMVVVFAVAVCPQTTLLIVVGMPWNSLVRVDLLHML